MEIFNKEDIYDNEISPLMRQIIGICKEHGIPMVASFTYENCEERGPGRCTTNINDIPNRKDDVHQKVVKTLYDGRHTTLAITIGEAK